MYLHQSTPPSKAPAAAGHASRTSTCWLAQLPRYTVDKTLVFFQIRIICPFLLIAFHVLGRSRREPPDIIIITSDMSVSTSTIFSSPLHLHSREHLQDTPPYLPTDQTSRARKDQQHLPQRPRHHTVRSTQRAPQAPQHRSAAVAAAAETPSCRRRPVHFSISTGTWSSTMTPPARNRRAP